MEFGSLTWQIVNGVFEFIRPQPLPTPAGVIFQNTGQAMTTNQIMTATVQLGNSSAVKKRVTVLLQDADFSDLTACTFWLPPYQPMAGYTIRGFTTKAWTNATVAVYAASVGSQTWTRVDNVTFDRTPATTIVGTECVEPAASAPEIASLAAGGSQLTEIGGFQRVSEREDHTPRTPKWRVLAGDIGHEVLYWNEPIDLTSASSAELTFSSSLSAAGSSGQVQVSTDGIMWQTATAVPAIEGQMALNLTPYAGQIIYVRFVLSTHRRLTSQPDSWTIDDVSLKIRGLR